MSNFEDYADFGQDFSYRLLRRVYDRGTVFLVRDQDRVAAYYRVVYRADTVELVHMYVAPDYRGQRLTEMFCWFLHSREGKTIAFGVHQSPDAVALIASLYRSGRFEMFWTNGSDREPYDPATADQHYGVGEPNEWQIIAENDWARGRFPLRNVMPNFDILAESYSLFDHY